MGGKERRPAVLRTCCGPAKVPGSCRTPFYREERAPGPPQPDQLPRRGSVSPGPGLSPAHRAELKPKALVPSWKPCSFCPRGLAPHLCSCLLPAPRLTGLEESAWGDEEDPEHNYYNSIPGKEPPVGGLVDSRLALTQPCALWALGQVSQGPRGGGALGGGTCGRRVPVLTPRSFSCLSFCSCSSGSRGGSPVHAPSCPQICWAPC